jgi:hypothetical protein
MRRAADANRAYFREAYRTGIHGWKADDPSPYAVDFLKELAALLPPLAFHSGAAWPRFNRAPGPKGIKTMTKGHAAAADTERKTVSSRSPTARCRTSSRTPGRTRRSRSPRSRPA